MRCAGNTQRYSNMTRRRTAPRRAPLRVEMPGALRTCSGAGGARVVGGESFGCRRRRSSAPPPCPPPPPGEWHVLEHSGLVVATAGRRHLNREREGRAGSLCKQAHHRTNVLVWSWGWGREEGWRCDVEQHERGIRFRRVRRLWDGLCGPWAVFWRRWRRGRRWREPGERANDGAAKGTGAGHHV